MEKIRVGNVSARGGEKTSGLLKAGELSDGSSIDIPVNIINGVNEGPVVYSQVACHGEEINGIEVHRRIFSELDPGKMSGAVILIPVANVLAYRLRQSMMPVKLDEYFINMNRAWPGKPDGSLSERMAHVMFNEAVEKADYVIDFHTGWSGMIDHTVFMAEDEKTEELARIFGTKVLVSEATKREEWEKERFSGKLRVVATKRGKPSICPELGGMLRFDWASIKKGIRGFKNVMKYLRMIKGKPELPRRQVVISNHLGRINANRGGIFIPESKLGDMLSKGDVVGKIYSIRKLFKEVETLKAPCDGLLYSLWDNPVVYSGANIGLIGKIIKETTNP